jgi:hypothetical protein
VRGVGKFLTTDWIDLSSPSQLRVWFARRRSASARLEQSRVPPRMAVAIRGTPRSAGQGRRDPAGAVGAKRRCGRERHEGLVCMPFRGQRRVSRDGSTRLTLAQSENHITWRGPARFPNPGPVRSLPASTICPESRLLLFRIMPTAGASRHGLHCARRPCRWKWKLCLEAWHRSVPAYSPVLFPEREP